MNIQGIQNYSELFSKTKINGKNRQHSKGTSLSSSIKDTYETTTETSRAGMLASIKKKIKSGYYNSDEVAEDLSHSFAKLFDKGL